MARLGLGTAVTFYEADIVLTALVNARLGHDWANPEAKMIAGQKAAARVLASTRFRCPVLAGGFG